MASLVELISLDQRGLKVSIEASWRERTKVILEESLLVCWGTCSWVMTFNGFNNLHWQKLVHHIMSVSWFGKLLYYLLIYVYIFVYFFIID